MVKFVWGGGIRDFAVILEVHAFGTKFCKGYPIISFTLIAFLFSSFLIHLGGVLWHKPGVANLFGVRAKLFGKILEKSNFCPCS
jgi:hypothetical protein